MNSSATSNATSTVTSYHATWATPCGAGQYGPATGDKNA